MAGTNQIATNTANGQRMRATPAGQIQRGEMFVCNQLPTNLQSSVVSRREELRVTGTDDDKIVLLIARENDLSSNIIWGNIRLLVDENRLPENQNTPQREVPRFPSSSKDE